MDHHLNSLASLSGAEFPQHNPLSFISINRLFFILLSCTFLLNACKMPRSYESTSVVKIHPSMLESFKPMNSSSVNQEKTSIEDEIKMVQSQNVLQEAATQSKLDLLLIKNSLHSVTSKKDNFIEVTARHHNPATAKLIAESVAAAYIEVRNTHELERAEKALSDLDRELEQQSMIIKEKRKALDQLLKEYDIPILDSKPSDDKESPETGQKPNQ